MKSRHLFLSAFLLTMGLTVGPGVASVGAGENGGKGTYIGVIGDSMCGTKHMKDTKDADCIRMCINHGSDYTLVAGDKTYTLKGDKDKIGKFAGAKVKVNGTLSSDAITVDSIEAVAQQK